MRLLTVSLIWNISKAYSGVEVLSAREVPEGFRGWRFHDPDFFFFGLPGSSRDVPRPPEKSVLADAQWVISF